MRSPLLDRPGAVAADPPDDGVAGHYGDPLREQRTLAEAAGVVDRSHRGIVAVSGPDRLSWLHSLTSQHLSALPAGAGTEALVLSPHGHVEHHLVVADDGVTTWLDVEPGTAGALVTYLDSMRFLLRVEPRDVTADWALVTVVGPGAVAAVSPLLACFRDRDGAGVAIAAAAPSRSPEGEWPAYGVRLLTGGGFARRMPWPGPDAVDLLVPRGDLADRVRALDLPLSGHDAFEALRVEAHRPRVGKETDHRTIPHEVGWIGVAVHLDKGCYRGQETVARVHNLGRPPRRLVLLHLDGSEERLPATGAAVEGDGRTVGFVGTAVRHYDLGPTALAIVKRATPDDATLTADGVPAAVERLVDANW